MTRASLLIVAVAVLAGAAGLFLGRLVFAPDAAPSMPTGVESVGVGDRRIDAAVQDLEGKPRQLAEFDGAPLVINFWATWCPPCVRELPLLDRWNEQEGLRVVAIALETDRQPVLDFVRAQGLRLPVRIAAPGREDLSTRYGNARGVLPFSVLLDGAGRVLAQRVGELDEAQLEQWRALVQGGTAATD
jgi:thiol-disulfide isomerase/thioredoxin